MWAVTCSEDRFQVVRKTDGKLVYETADAGSASSYLGDLNGSLALRAIERHYSSAAGDPTALIQAIDACLDAARAIFAGNRWDLPLDADYAVDLVDAADNIVDDLMAHFGIDDPDDDATESAAAGHRMPYGDVTYADPGYQSDRVKRYPIDTPGHAKAAWDYINHPDDAAKYSSSQLAAIKARIRGAAKKHGVEVSG